MEALASIMLALLAIVLLEAARAIAICLLGWALFLALGALAARLCLEVGADADEAAITGLLAAMLTRNLVRALANRFRRAGVDG